MDTYQNIKSASIGVRQYKGMIEEIHKEIELVDKEIKALASRILMIANNRLHVNCKKCKAIHKVIDNVVKN